MMEAWSDTLTAWVGDDTAWQPTATDQSVATQAAGFHVQSGSGAANTTAAPNPSAAQADCTVRTATVTGHCPATPDALEVACSTLDGTATAQAGIGVAPLGARWHVLAAAIVARTAVSPGEVLCALITGHGLGAARADAAVAVRDLILDGQTASPTVTGIASPQTAVLGLRVASIADAAQTAWQFPSDLTTALRLSAPTVTSLSLASGMALACTRPMPLATQRTWRTPVTTTLRIDAPLEIRAA
jgi:hypothetical protein